MQHLLLTGSFSAIHIVTKHIFIRITHYYIMIECLSSNRNLDANIQRNGLLLLLQVIILKCVIRKEMFSYPHAITTHIKVMLI